MKDGIITGLHSYCLVMKLIASDRAGLVPWASGPIPFAFNPGDSSAKTKNINIRLTLYFYVNFWTGCKHETTGNVGAKKKLATYS